MSSRQQNDELERIQDRLNRARNNRTAASASDQAVPPATSDSNVTSRIRASAGSSMTSGGGTSSAWESVNMTSPAPRTSTVGIRGAFNKAASSRRIVAQDQSINLRGGNNQDSFASPEQGARGSMLFTRDTSARNLGNPPFADEFDADPNAESEEYIAAYKNRLNPFMAAIAAMCADCYTSLAYHADRLYLNCARGGDKTKINCGISLIVAIFGIMGIVHFTKSSAPTTFTGASEEVPSNFSPTLSGRAGDIQTLLVEAGITSAEVLTDKNTIQHTALLWIAKEDPAKLDKAHPAILERYILTVLYAATNVGDDEEPTWTNKDGWMTGSGHCSWYGVECVPRDDPNSEEGIARSYDDNDHITGLSLGNNNLRGTLPPEVGKLANTIELEFHDNGLSGEFPELHENLKYLLIANNQMEGFFPKHFSKLANLHGLDISNNALHGHVPEDISKLVELRTLDMSNNNFAGSFPAIHGSTKLTKISLQNNHFDGTIPTGKLRDYERLEVLRLENNTFSGPFPKQSIERLQRIEYIDFSHNDLTGSIPDIFQSVRRLLSCHLNNNRFRSTIPDSLLHLSGLKSIRLENNFLTGTIPETVALLADLETLDLSGNLLTGQIPTYIGFPNDFTAISLKNNKFTGSIPSEMGNLFRLTSLELEGNQLSGEIPQELSSITTLQTLSLFENKFSGITMPVGLCDRIRRGEMKKLSADCADETPLVTCDCCTKCYPLAGTN